MITYQAIGRLGNQMFQAAACIGYSKKYGEPWACPQNTRESPNFHNYFPGLPITNEQPRRYQEHPDQFCDLHGVHKNLCHFNYHPIPKIERGATLVGFWQSWKYFEGADEEIKQAFRLKEYPELKDCVSIHVRRGDYVHHSGSFPPIDLIYIKEAIYKLGIPKIMAFSDDLDWMKWAASQFSQFEWSFSEGTEYEDLCMMASCGHNIIANSTFSWWAAFLNKNPNKIVVSPSHKRGNWFGLNSGVKQDCVDLLPDSWHQIEFR